MSAEQTFEAMRRVVEAPGYAFLKHYRQDFYEFDRQYLERTFSTEAQYLWIVREMGSHLINLGVHPKMGEEASAVFESTSKLASYLVTEGKVRQLTLEHAKDLVRKLRYKVDGAVVTGPRGRLASFRIEISPWSKGNRVGVVHFRSISASAASNLADLVALVQIAECEVINATQSLFTPTDMVWLDGADVRAMLIERRRGPLGPVSIPADVALCD